MSRSRCGRWRQRPQMKSMILRRHCAARCPGADVSYRGQKHSIMHAGAYQTHLLGADALCSVSYVAPISHDNEPSKQATANNSAALAAYISELVHLTGKQSICRPYHLLTSAGIVISSGIRRRQYCIKIYRMSSASRSTLTSMRRSISIGARAFLFL